MASTFLLKLPTGTTVDAVADALARLYTQKGFTITTNHFPYAIVLDMDRGVGGRNMLLGLDLGIKVTLSVNDDTLTVNYSDGAWIGKIIGLLVGWFLCGIPVVTALFGAMRQNELPARINRDIATLFPIKNA